MFIYLFYYDSEILLFIFDFKYLLSTCNSVCFDKNGVNFFGETRVDMGLIEVESDLLRFLFKTKLECYSGKT